MLLIVAAAGTAAAQPVTTPAQVLRAGTVEIETNVADRRSDAPRVDSTAVEVRYALTDRVQLHVGTDNALTLQPGSHAHVLDGAYVGLKLAIADQALWLPAIAVTAAAVLPTSDDDDAIAQTTDVELRLHLSRDLGAIAHVDAMLGVDVVSARDRPAVQRVAALAVSRPVAGEVSTIVEGYTFEGAMPYASHDAGLVWGLGYAPRPWVSLAAGADLALYRDTRDFTLFFGVTLVSTRPR